MIVTVSCRSLREAIQPLDAALAVAAADAREKLLDVVEQGLGYISGQLVALSDAELAAALGELADALADDEAASSALFPAAVACADATSDAARAAAESRLDAVGEAMKDARLSIDKWCVKYGYDEE